MSKWRIHWNNGVMSDWMETEALYNCVWGVEANVLYIESEDMKPHIDNVIFLMMVRGYSAVTQFGEVILYNERSFYIGEHAVQTWEVRAALQVKYTVAPEDYIEDEAYVAEKKAQVVAGSPL